MSHKWQLNGIKFNFCVKCGCKKTYAGRWHRCMSKTAYGKKLQHKLEIIIDGRLTWMPAYCKCKVCQLEENSRHSNIMWSTDDTGIAYVPYKLIKNNNGTTLGKHCKWWNWQQDPVSKEWGKVPIPGLAFWPVFCLLTEDEAMIKDLIL